MKKNYKLANVIVETTGFPLEKGESRRTTTTLTAEPNHLGIGAKLLIVERPFTPRPDRQGTSITRTLHLTLKRNATHFLIQGYIPRTELGTNATKIPKLLADLLNEETEQLTNQLD